MNHLIVFLVSIFLLPINICQAEWMSDVDKKYEVSKPQLYKKVAKAKTLISSANGNSDLNYQALGILREVLKKDQKFAPAYVQVARLIANFGHRIGNEIDGSALMSQEGSLLAALKIEPNYDYAIVMMGYTKMYQGKLDEAEDYYKRAIKMKSHYPYLKSQMAQLERRRGNYPQSLELGIQAYNENIDTPTIAAGAITEIIYSYEKLDGDNNNELEVWHSKREELEPNIAWNWGHHAQFRLYRIGDYENSIKYAKKALSLMNYQNARCTLAKAYYAKWANIKDIESRKAEAEEIFAKARSIYVSGEMVALEFGRNPVLKSASKPLLKKMTGLFTKYEDLKKQDRCY